MWLRTRSLTNSPLGVGGSLAEALLRTGRAGELLPTDVLRPPPADAEAESSAPVGREAFLPADGEKTKNKLAQIFGTKNLEGELEIEIKSKTILIRK